MDRRRGDGRHLFVFTLGYSRRCFAYAYPQRAARRRCSTATSGPSATSAACRSSVCTTIRARWCSAGRAGHGALASGRFEDFARYYGFTPRACQPYRPQTKGKVESGVKYVKRNALAGRRFGSGTALEALARGVGRDRRRCARPRHDARAADRLASPRETSTPLGTRPPYHYHRVQTRIVPPDALVSIAAGALLGAGAATSARRSTVHETATHYELVVGDTCIAQHAKAARHAVVMEPGPLRRAAAPPGPAARDAPAAMGSGLSPARRRRGPRPRASTRRSPSSAVAA